MPIKGYLLPRICTAYFMGVPPFIFYIGVPDWIDMFFRTVLGIAWFGLGITLPLIWSLADEWKIGRTD